MIPRQHPAWQIMRRDALRRFRQPAGWLIPVFFFVATIAVFAIGVGGDPKLLHLASSGILWGSALFAVLLTQENIFRNDISDGFAEQLVVSGTSLTMVSACKSLVHWLYTGLPLVLATPIGALLLNLPLEKLPFAMASLIIGTMLFCLLASFVSSMTALSSNNVLATLLALPLALPTLVFGSVATASHLSDLPTTAGSLFMLANLAFGITVFPLATAGVLRSCVGLAR